MSGRDAARVIPVYVVVPPRALLLDVAGPVEVLRMTNLAQPDLCFEVRFVGAAPRVHSSVGLGLAGLAPLPARLPGDAMVLVSGSVDVPLGEPPAAERDDEYEAAIVAWLRRVIRPGVRLVTICAGAMLAARAGLLDGYECTTHHENIDRLAQLAPRARIRENRLFVQDGERMTSAGVTAGVDLILAIVAQEAGHAIALTVARKLVVYLRRTGADPQLSPWLEGRNHLHPAIHRVQDAVGADPARPWTLPALADVAATSPRHLSRLFNEHAAMSVTDYVNRMRVALARQLVVGSTLDMERVAERSGFSSARQFRRAWGRVYAVPPARLRGAEA